MRNRAFLLAAVGFALAAPTPLRSQAATNNPHGGTIAECTECHLSDRWTPLAKPTRFQHGSTGFALEEAHAQVACRSCHQSLVFSRVGVTCLDCHKDAHAGELGVQCQACHTTRSWNVQRDIFRTHSRTRFPLFAAHASLDCGACHRGQRPWEYANTPIDCAPCHAATFDQTKNPPHAATGFPRDCLQCHSNLARDWRDTNWQHPASFRLTGAHVRAGCAGCHANGYKGTTHQCVGCHMANYQRTTNPNHVANHFPTQCQNCHSTNAWQPGFDHSQSRFPLTGAHAGLDCALCHVGGRFAGTPTDCYSCHKANYDGTTKPNHASAGFPTTCQNCHTTTAWTPANFDHSRTGFPLTGAHAGLDCTKCHVGGKFAGTPTDCYACHKADYDGAKSPDHSSFPTTCATCHSTNAWRPANFDHNKTGFPLTGAHVRVDCAKCHPGGRYAGTPTDCYSCHQADYNGTTNPNHRASGFPTTCQSCHTTNAWRPASFNHDGFFPIYSGRHAGTWSSCQDCHTNPNNYGVFSCLGCHAHNQSDMNSKHRDVSGYAYESSACYRCHPRGTAGGDLRFKRFRRPVR